jgi:hypothetical protein
LVAAQELFGKESVKQIRKQEGETVQDVVRRAYCVRGRTGEEDADRIKAAVAAVGAANPDFSAVREVSLPAVPGVPDLRAVIGDVQELRAAIEKLLPQIEGDPVLHALSFADPLRLCTEHLGIAVTPLVANQVRLILGAKLSFDPSRSLAAQPGVGKIRWRANEP